MSTVSRSRSRRIGGEVALISRHAVRKEPLPLSDLGIGQPVRGWPLVTVPVGIGVFKRDAEGELRLVRNRLPAGGSCRPDTHGGGRLAAQQVGVSQFPAVAADPDAGRLPSVAKTASRGS